jgi:dethiobiotin synthetase
MKNGIGQGFFITGTDTGIGKTFISRLLCDSFAEWQPITYMKPVQTGCTRRPGGELSAPDFDFVMEGRAVMVGSPDDHVPYRFEPACSPHLAAARAGALISLEDIKDRFSRISNKKSVTIVEGAGGVLAPLSETLSMLDLMLHLGLPVIVVTSPRIGTLNHTFLTLLALADRSIEPVGVVINNAQNLMENYIYHDTRRMIQDRIPDASLLEIPFKDDETPLDALDVADTVKEFTHEIFGRL